MTRHLLLAAGLVGLTALPVLAQTGALVQSGKEIYAAKRCARCHRIADKGYKDGRLDGVAARLSDADMRKWLTAPAEMEARLDEPPKVKMSSRKKMTLTDAEVTALVAYLRTLRAVPASAP
jgi:mono/diheme cytochrome c family protein